MSSRCAASCEAGWWAPLERTERGARQKAKQSATFIQRTMGLNKAWPGCEPRKTGRDVTHTWFRTFIRLGCGWLSWNSYPNFRNQTSFFLLFHPDKRRSIVWKTGGSSYSIGPRALVQAPYIQYIKICLWSAGWRLIWCCWRICYQWISYLSHLLLLTQLLCILIHFPLLNILFSLDCLFPLKKRMSKDLPKRKGKGIYSNESHSLTKSVVERTQSPYHLLSFHRRMLSFRA